MMGSTKAITYSNTYSLVLLQESRSIVFSLDVFSKPVREVLKTLLTLAYTPVSAPAVQERR